VCTVTGAVDWTTSPLVRDALTETRRDDNVHLVIDLSAVTSMDSAVLILCSKLVLSTTSVAAVI